MGDNLLRSDLLVRQVLTVGDVVRSGPASVETDAGAAEEALALLGDGVAVWALFHVGPAVEGRVKL